MNKEDSMPQIGISEENRIQIADGLKSILANSYVLMLKTQNYHWNVRGQLFKTIHELTETQYTNLFSAIDEIAERIRSLGIISPGSLEEFSELNFLKEINSSYSDIEMIEDLVDGHEAITRKLREVVVKAGECGDEGTADLLTSRLEFHEKTAWMMRSLLEG